MDYVFMIGRLMWRTMPWTMLLGLTACGFPSLQREADPSVPSDAGSSTGASVSDIGSSGIDSNVPSFCYGTSIVKVCFSAPLAGTQAFGSPTVLDTDASPLCVTPSSGGAGDCVVAATTSQVNATLRATGSK